MNLSRKDFLLRSGTAMLPLSLPSVASSMGSERGRADPDQAQFNVRRFGARGDGQTKETAALQRAMDAAGVNGGTVYVPAGNYVSGTVRFHSHVSVFLEAGATLILSPDREDFDRYEKLPFKQPDDKETTDMHYALLRGQDVEHVSISGTGTIDGYRKQRGGPKPVAFKNCRHVSIREVTLQNAPNYNISLLGCDYVTIEGVTILKGHADGIDPDNCRFVRIANCFVESWDDAIVAKASFALGKRRSTEHMTVTNCVLTSACSCFKLGTESCGDFKNITLSNCAMFGRTDLWTRNPQAGIALEMVDGAALERVAVSNVLMADIQTPIFVRLGNRGRSQDSPMAGSLREISLADIRASGAIQASSITGIAGHPVREITLRNVRVSSRGAGGAGLAAKEVAEAEGKYPNADMFGELPAYGLFCRHAEGVTLDNVSFELEQPDGRPGAIFDRVKDLQLRAVSAAAPSGEEPALWLRDVAGCFMQGLCAQRGTRNCVKVSGEKSSAIRAIGNDFSQAANAFKIGKEVEPGAVRQEGNLMGA